MSTLVPLLDSYSKRHLGTPSLKITVVSFGTSDNFRQNFIVKALPHFLPLRSTLAPLIESHLMGITDRVRRSADSVHSE